MEHLSREERERLYAFGAGTVYSVVAGSHAYGLSGPDSDRDVIGCFVSTPAAFLGMDSARKYRSDIPDVSLSRLDEFAVHLVNGSSYWVETLFVPEDSVEVSSPAFAPFIEAREMFLAQALVTKSLGFMDAMARRAEKGQDTPERRQKQLMHAVRVGRMILEMFETSRLRVRREDEREELLAMKRGDVPYEDLMAQVRDLYSKVDLRLSRCGLPEDADVSVVNDMVWQVARAHWVSEGLL